MWLEKLSKEDFLDEDILDVKLGTRKMYFDGTINQYGNGIGILLITTERHILGTMTSQNLWN